MIEQTKWKVLFKNPKTDAIEALEIHGKNFRRALKRAESIAKKRNWEIFEEPVEIQAGSQVRMAIEDRLSFLREKIAAPQHTQVYNVGDQNYRRSTLVYPVKNGQTIKHNETADAEDGIRLRYFHRSRMRQKEAAEQPGRLKNQHPKPVPMGS